MRKNPMLRLLLAGLFLYVALPRIPLASSPIEMTFWGMWVGLFILVVGSNLATLLEITRPPLMEQEELRRRNTQ